MSRPIFLILTALIVAIILIYCSRPHTNGRENKKYSTEQLKNDFLLLRKALEEAHPGLYRYSSKKITDSRFDSVFSLLNKEMTRLDFYQLITPMIAKIRCAHTASWIFTDSIFNQKHFFPFSLQLIENKAYISRNVSSDSTLVVGTEILSINDISMNNLIREMLPNISSDGYIKSSKFYTLGLAFFKSYYKFTDQPDSFKLLCNIPDNNQKKIVVVPAMSGDTIVAMLNKKSRTKDMQAAHKSFAFKILNNSNTAVLTIRNFIKTNFPFFLKSTFKEIKDQNIQNLIIDLRGNQGGNTSFVGLLFSYLTDTPFKHLEYVEIKTYQKFSFIEYTDLPSNYFDVNPAHYSKTDSGTYLWITNPNLGIKQPKKNNYKENLYILIDGGTQSAGAAFAALCHHYKRAVFIGEEPAEAYNGGNAGMLMVLKLPDTKIKVRIPLRKMVHGFSDYPYKGRGVIPDYHVTPTIEDIINGIDTEMEFTLKLIEKKGSK